MHINDGIRGRGQEASHAASGILVLTGSWTCAPFKAQSLNHWTTRKVPSDGYLQSNLRVILNQKGRIQIVWCYLFLKEVFYSQRVKRNHNPHFNIYKLAIFISHILQERSLEQRERSTLPKSTCWENERAGAGGQVRARLWTKSSTGSSS